jgi:CHAT domain-containing protein
MFVSGAQCVLTNMWPLPDIAVEKFYTSFYLALQSGAQSATAISTAIEALKNDDRYIFVTNFSILLLKKNRKKNLGMINLFCIRYFFCLFM